MLFLIYKSSLAMLAAYLYILWIDCIYKTNCFRLPLFYIVGATANKRTFNAGFAFMQRETTEVYMCSSMPEGDILVIYYRINSYS